MKVRVKECCVTKRNNKTLKRKEIILVCFRLFALKKIQLDEKRRNRTKSAVLKEAK